MQIRQDTQRRAFTGLTNIHSVIPIPHEKIPRSKAYIEGRPAETAIRRDLSLVSTPEEADIAVLRLQAPYDPRQGVFERKFHAESLEFPHGEIRRVSKILHSVPLIVLDICLDHPAVLTPLVEEQERKQNHKRSAIEGIQYKGDALVVNIGSDADTFLHICFGIEDALLA
jgi:hypothetical protein